MKIRQIDKNRITQSVIIGIVSVSAAAALTSLRAMLYTEGGWLGPIVALYIWFVFLGLAWIFFKSKALFLVAIAAVLISFLIIFGISAENAIAVIIALIFFGIGSFEALQEKKLRVKFRIGKILDGSLPHAVTALAVLIAVAYYASPYVLGKATQIEIPRELFDAVVAPLTTAIEGSVAPSMPFGMGMSGMIEEGIQEVADELYININQIINRYSHLYRDYLIIGLSIGIFFTVKMFGFFMKWLIILTVWLVFKGLTHFGAVRIQEHSVLQEVIES